MSDLALYARPYARALFELAQNDPKALERWQSYLAKLAAVANDKDVKAILTNPACNQKKLAQFLIEQLGNEINEQEANLLKLLAEKKRLLILPILHQAFKIMADQMQNVVQANLYSAAPLSEALQKEILTKLQAKLHKKVELKTAIDESLIGGLQLSVGDYVIDASVRGALHRLATDLLR